MWSSYYQFSWKIFAFKLNAIKLRKENLMVIERIKLSDLLLLNIEYLFKDPVNMVFFKST